MLAVALGRPLGIEDADCDGENLDMSKGVKLHSRL